MAVLLVGCGISGIYHQVKKGETLYSIASRYNVDLIEVVLINDIKNPALIHEGEYIYIPVSDVKRETKRQPRRKKAAKDKRSRGPNVNEAPATKVIFQWPVKGKITKRFEISRVRRHSGIDISAPEGTPVMAADKGEVIYSDDNLVGYGNLIIIRHKGGFASVYAHNKRNLVKAGDNVRRGQEIAKVGRTGWATGPHLHFEVRRKNKAVNPLKYLP